MNIYGAVIGDIVGSIYEVNEMKKIKSGLPKNVRQKILDKNTPLFSSESSFTDDSILTCAIAKACLTDNDYEKQIRYYGNKEKDLGLDVYGRSKFGPGFLKWLEGLRTSFLNVFFDQRCHCHDDPRRAKNRAEHPSPLQ